MKVGEVGLALLFTGFFFIFAAAALLFLSPLAGEVSVGGCVAIAVPIPICFGTGPAAPLLILISYAVFFALLIAALLLLLPLRKGAEDVPTPRAAGSPH